MHLVQVCNVGEIVGGTAACAWTVTQALPGWQHTVLFLTRITEATRAAFANANIAAVSHVDARRLRSLRADIVLLHNSSPSRVQAISSVPAIMYQHSVGQRTSAQRKVYCSRWLARACDDPHGDVLLQAVPIPPRPTNGESRSLRTRLKIGRICTPNARKWPTELVPFYAELARRFPAVDWEFVGCPVSLERELSEACQGRAAFHPAGWSARSHLWHWDALLYHNPALPESFGRVVAESLRSGCVPIVDALGGFTEQFPPEAGFLCSSRADFREALEQISQPGTLWSMSRTALAHGNEHFSLLRFQDSLLELFEQTGLPARREH